VDGDYSWWFHHPKPIYSPPAIVGKKFIHWCGNSDYLLRHCPNQE